MTGQNTDNDRLSELLDGDESVIDSISSEIMGLRENSGSIVGAIATTNKRILLVGRIGVFRKKDIDSFMNHSDILNIEWKPKGLRPTLSLQGKVGKWQVMPLCQKEEAEAFVAHLEAQLAADSSRESGKNQRIDDQWNELRPWHANKYKGEWAMLYNLIEDRENLECLVGGEFGPDLGQAKPFKSMHSGIGVATNKRIMLVDKSFLGSSEVAELPYQSIEAITYGTGMILAGIRITGRGTMSFRLEMVEKIKSSHLWTVYGRI